MVNMANDNDNWPLGNPNVAADLARMARVNCTWAGNNGDLPDPVAYDADDRAIKGMVQEAVRTGGIPGIPADAGADLTDFVVDRFPASAEIPHPRVFIRPKTPFGVSP